MTVKRKEEGLTLIEVLISIVILSIVFLSFMNFFPQMGLMNSQNQDKTQAINTAKQLLINWQSSQDVKNFLSQTTSGSLPGYTGEDDNYYYCSTSTTDGKITVNIKIKKISDLASGPSQERLIKIQLLNRKNLIVSEIYGYIKLN